MENPTLPFPNIHPSGRVIKSGDVVLTEISAKYGGYWGQVQKPFSIGNPSERYRELIKVNRELYRIISEALHPANTLGNVNTVGSRYLASTALNASYVLRMVLVWKLPKSP